MSFNEIPPEMLAMVLNKSNIPLKERILLRRVAKNWLSTIEADFRHQSKLVVYGNRDGEKRASDDLVISSDKFTADFVKKITSQFPSIADLTLNTFSKTSYQQLSNLLKPYRGRLTTLSISGQYFFSNSTVLRPFDATQRLVTALNALPNLTTLKLSGYHLTKRLIRNMAPTLARLESFDLKHDRSRQSDFGEVIFTLLSNRCTRLHLPSFCIPYNDGTLDTTNIDDSLNHLEVGMENEHLTGAVANLVNRLRLLFAANDLHAVRSLRLLFNGLRLLSSNLLHELSVLQQITDLDLNSIQFRQNLLAVPIPTERRLVNVKRLTIGLNCVESDQMTSATLQHMWSCLSAWCPRLERFTINCCPRNYNAIQGIVGQIKTSCVINVSPSYGRA